MKKSMNNKGFSLVELIIVIAIMAVLMGVLAPQFIKYVESSRKQKDESAAGEVQNAANIALSIESIYKATPTSGATVVAADGAQVTCAAVTSLQDEIRKTIPGNIDYTSKAHDGGTYTITLSYDSNAESFKLSGTW